MTRWIAMIGDRLRRWGERLAAPAGLGEASDRAERTATWLSALTTIAVVSALLLATICAPRFGVDAWSYLELSDTIFSEFYRTNTLRQFELDTPYSSAFPPAWPILIALVRTVCDLGVYTTVLLNFFVAVALVAASIRLMRTFGAAGSTGPVLVLCLFSVPHISGDLTAGGTAIPSVLLLTLLTLGLVQSKLPRRRLVVSGIIAGAAILTRFDFLPAGVLMGLYATSRIFRTDGATAAVKAFVLYFAPICLLAAPWSFYCLARFGTPWVSDNARQFATAYPGHVLNFYETPPENDLIHRPGTWLSGFLTQKSPSSLRSLATGTYASYLPSLLLFALAALGNFRFRPPPEAARFFLLGSIVVPCLLLPACLVGYADARYFSAFFLWASVVCLLILSSQLRAVWVRPQILIALPFLAAPIVYQNAVKPVIGSPKCCSAPIRATTEMTAIAAAVRRDAGGKSYRLLYLHDAMRTNRDGAMYGALTGEPTSLTPHNIDDRLAAFVQSRRITHLYDGANMRRDLDLSGVELIPLEVSDLFRIETVGSN